MDIATVWYSSDVIQRKGSFMGPGAVAKLTTSYFDSSCGSLLIVILLSFSPYVLSVSTVTCQQRLMLFTAMGSPVTTALCMLLCDSNKGSRVHLIAALYSGGAAANTSVSLARWQQGEQAVAGVGIVI